MNEKQSEGVKYPGEFIKDLAKLINIHSMENQSNTPDYILAEFMFICLQAFNKAIEQRAASR